jgi:hypothetical protein
MTESPKKWNTSLRIAILALAAVEAVGIAFAVWKGRM